jgi:hypothetical protein
VLCSADDAGRPDGIGERSSTDSGTRVGELMCSVNVPGRPQIPAAVE